MPASDHGPSRRIWSRLPAGVRETLTDGLSPTDLQSLLLEVARERAQAVGPARLAQRWRDDRFAQPSAADPRRLSRLEARMWQLLPERFAGVELSPVTPLGSSAGVGTTDQNRVLSTVRNSEVVSDLTNVLALEAARRRRADGAAEVHLAACHRVLRHHAVPDGGSSHFKLFGLVSSARDRGSARTEADLLIIHLAYWRAVLEALLPDREVEIAYSVFDNPALEQRVLDTVLPGVESDHPAGSVQLVADPGRTRARGYYTSGAILITAGDTEVGDGGFTNWTAQLLTDNKERCLTSCLSPEGLLMLDPKLDG